MNIKQAQTKLRKLLGPKAAIKDKKRPSSPEQREQERAARIAITALKKAAEEAMQARQQAVLEADPEYQRLKAEYQAARDEQERTPYGTYHRYSTGRVNGVGGFSLFSVEAEADTLAELVEKVEAKRMAA